MQNIFLYIEGHIFPIVSFFDLFNSILTYTNIKNKYSQKVDIVFLFTSKLISVIKDINNSPVFSKELVIDSTKGSSLITLFNTSLDENILSK